MSPVRRHPAVFVLLAMVLVGPATAAETAPQPTEPQRLAETDEAFARCIAGLKALGARFEIGPPVAEEEAPECGILRPLRVSQIARGVAFDPPGEMRCAMALALAEWVDSFVVPASRNLPDRGIVTRIEQRSTYVCRRRNGQSAGPQSEHAFGNAVDIGGFAFAGGKPIAVESPERAGTPGEAFQRAVRATACLKFTTVLGPGTDADHADHLHLDIKSRSGGYRLCQ